MFHRRIDLNHETVTDKYLSNGPGQTQMRDVSIEAMQERVKALRIKRLAN